MKNIDKHNKLEKEEFSYIVSKEQKVFIYRKSQQIMILKNKQAEVFLSKVNYVDAIECQLIMAKITGNYKHGNEKLNKKKNKYLNNIG